MRLEMVTEVILEKYYTLTLTTDHIGKKIKVAVEEENYKSINKIKKLLKLAYWKKVTEEKWNLEKQ